MVEKRRQDRPVTFPLEGVAAGAFSKQPGLFVTQGRRQAFVGIRLRPLHPLDRIVDHRVALAEVLKEG